MNAPSRTRKAAPGKPATPPAPLSEWTHPIADGAPCGPNLEYDNDYAVLLAKLTPQSEVQYGDFVGKPESPDWSDIERDCRRLLARSKDIVLLVCLCRCRARLGGATGLADALEGLLEILHAYPDAVHPQLVVDGQADPAVRANAMANLADPGGLLADMRDIVVASNAAFHLTLKDLERSFAVPRPADAIAPETVQQQLAELQARGATEMSALARIAAAAEAIAAWSQHHLGEAAPDLRPLRQLLARIPTEEVAPARIVTMPTEAPAAVPRQDAVTTAEREPADLPPLNSFTPDMSPAQGRAHARQVLRAVRHWLQVHEPSSPVTVLLQQAERMVGMGYGELARAIPLELFTQWENTPPPRNQRRHRGRHARPDPGLGNFPHPPSVPSPNRRCSVSKPFNTSGQKFIGRNRAPRVQIQYDVEIYGSEKKIELPFVMGVLADLSGKPALDLPPVADRKFLEIDIDNFDERMKAIRPRVAFSVPNTLTGDGYLMVDLTFECMEDFSPAAVARKVEPLAKLLDARTQLSNLLTYMDGKSGAEDLLRSLLKDPALLKSLATTPKPHIAPADSAEAAV